MLIEMAVRMSGLEADEPSAHGMQQPLMPDIAARKRGILILIRQFTYSIPIYPPNELSQC